jgi:hypothetical protein
MFTLLVVPGGHTITITMVATQIYSNTFNCVADIPMDLGVLATAYNPGAFAIDDDGDGYSDNAGDCDDADPDTHPGADEICNDGMDNDCDWDTDCDDGDCALDPLCSPDDTADTSLLWILPYDPEVPVATYSYSGGIAVQITFYQEFRAIDDSGTLRLTAAVKADETDPTNLAEQSVEVDVLTGQTYTLITKVAVSNWGACDPQDVDTILFGSPTTTATSSIAIPPDYDPDWNWYRCIGRYGISEMRIQPSEGAIDSPVAGYWNGVAGFGQIEFRLTADGTAINRIRLELEDFSCGDAVDVSGSITVSSESGWPITSNTFTARLTLSLPLEREIQIAGSFADAGTTAGGTYTAEFNNSRCDGTWNASPAIDRSP